MRSDLEKGVIWTLDDDLEVFRLYVDHPKNEDRLELELFIYQGHNPISARTMIG